MKPGFPPDVYAMPGSKQEKRRAGVLTRKAIRRGDLVAQPCGECLKRGFPQTRKIQAHHEDYSRPLEVTWLCTLHHAFRHSHLRSAMRGALQQPEAAA